MIAHLTRVAPHGAPSHFQSTNDEEGTLFSGAGSAKLVRGTSRKSLDARSQAELELGAPGHLPDLVLPAQPGSRRGATLYLTAPPRVRWVGRRYMDLRGAVGRAGGEIQEVELVRPRRPRRRPAAIDAASGCAEPRYTFERFVIGPGNQLAHAAALAVAEAPGGLQPALPPRPARAGQDPPARRDRQLPPRRQPRAPRPLHDRRVLHQRVRLLPAGTGIDAFKERYREPTCC